MTLREQLIEKDKDMDEMRSQIESLKTDVYTTNRQLDGKKEELDAKVEQLTDCRDTITALNSDKANQHHANRKLEKRCERFKEDLQDSRNALEMEKALNEQSTAKMRQL